MVIVSIDENSEWYKANWVFRQLCKDVESRCPHDTEVKEQLETSLALGGLFLEDLNEDLRSRVIAAITSVAHDTLNGVIRGWQPKSGPDEAGQQMYLESLRELLELLRGETAP